VFALYAGIFLVSAAALTLELTLTRAFAVAQWYHFAFVSVSVALLGFGASGTWLALRPEASPGGPGRWADERHRAAPRRLTTFAFLFSLSTLLAYLAINRIPFDSYRVAWERRQLLYLALYYSALIVPFFFAGGCVGLPLAAWPERAHAVYAANLAGSAVGSLLMLVLLPGLGATGAVLCASAAGLLAAALLGRASRAPRLWIAICLASSVFVLTLVVHPPGWAALQVSPYKGLSAALLYPQANPRFSRWNAFSRVDVVESIGIHAAPGLSLSFAGEFHRQWGLFVDGGNLSPLICGPTPEGQPFLEYLPAAVPFQLWPGERVLILEPQAGLDILVALHGGASAVTAIESNPLVVRAALAQSDSCGASPYADRRVTVVSEDARSYLSRSRERFDMVLLSLSDTYMPVISGAYSLSENFEYTAEAFEAYLQHLQYDGLLVVTRWVQSPPSEELRACALVAEALERKGVTGASACVLAFRSWSTLTILARTSPFRSEEVAAWKALCAERGFDLVHYVGMTADEANRYNVLSNAAHFNAFELVLSKQERQNFLQQYAYDVSPPSDDQPFFFHYFRWSQTEGILQMLGKTWQPFGGGGFLVVLVLLALVLVLSAVLILLPLAVTGRPAAPRGGLFLLYFGCLGLGYLWVEMPLLQKFILFLGQPAYSFAVVLFSLLLFSGVGSQFSARLPTRPALMALAGMVLIYPAILARGFVLCLGWGLLPRLLVAVLSLAPLGFLLGMPLPAGVRLLRERAPQLIPWAWAVNGCASVTGSILAVLGAVTFGFTRVLVAGAFAYGAGWIIMMRLTSSLPRESA
jgi:hypothetical protein